MLIDLIAPTAAYSAAEFVDARRLIGEVRARGAEPLLVGGTMLYFKALFDGIDALPAADAAVRAALDERARALGWPALHASSTPRWIRSPPRGCRPQRRPARIQRAGGLAGRGRPRSPTSTPASASTASASPRPQAPASSAAVAGAAGPRRLHARAARQ